MKYSILNLVYRIFIRKFYMLNIEYRISIKKYNVPWVD